MFRFAAGCVSGLLLVAALGGAAAYFAWDYVGPLVSTVSDVKDGVTRLGTLTDIDRDLRRTGPFDAPTSGELTADQVTRFIRVQQQVRSTLGTRAEAFATKYRELSGRTPEGTVVVPSPAQLLGGLRDLSDVYLDAWRAQVQAMNDAAFARSEFSWVRARVYQAAGLDALRYDARDLASALERLAEGARLDVPAVTLPDAPAANRTLVRPHLDELKASLPMAAFGL